MLKALDYSTPWPAEAKLEPVRNHFHRQPVIHTTTVKHGMLEETSIIGGRNVQRLKITCHGATTRGTTLPQVLTSGCGKSSGARQAQHKKEQNPCRQRCDYRRCRLIPQSGVRRNVHIVNAEQDDGQPRVQEGPQRRVDPVVEHLPAQSWIRELGPEGRGQSGFERGGGMLLV